MFGNPKLGPYTLGSGPTHIYCDGCMVYLGERREDQLPPESERSEFKHYCMACDTYKDDD